MPWSLFILYYMTWKSHMWFQNMNISMASFWCLMIFNKCYWTILFQDADYLKGRLSQISSVTVIERQSGCTWAQLQNASSPFFPSFLSFSPSLSFPSFSSSFLFFLSILFFPSLFYSLSSSSTSSLLFFIIYKYKQSEIAGTLFYSAHILDDDKCHRGHLSPRI